MSHLREIARDDPDAVRSVANKAEGDLREKLLAALEEVDDD